MNIFFRLSLILTVVVASGCGRSGESWYPFTANILNTRYSAGPFPLTNNLNERNPFWKHIRSFNLMQARLTYAMTRGNNVAQIAWLHQYGEWPDKTGINIKNLSCNTNESPISKALVAAGFSYDRISRKNLEAARVSGTTFTIGNARYRALLVTHLRSATPASLARIRMLAERGIPVIFLGSLPYRAFGWRSHAADDAAVADINRDLMRLSPPVRKVSDIVESLVQAGVLPVLSAMDGPDLGVRLNVRKVENGYLLLLFNETGAPVVKKYRIALDPVESVDLLDPETGEIRRVAAGPDKTIIISVPSHRIRLVLVNKKYAASDWSDDRWLAPPRDCYPYVRWWWPGDAVDDDELKNEVRTLHEAGFGGIELQTLTLGLAKKELRERKDTLYRVGTESYFHHLKVVFEEAHRRGMRIDLTFGSGWPSGGPFITDHKEQHLLYAYVDMKGPRMFDGELPRVKPPEYISTCNRIINGVVGDSDTAASLEAVVAARIDTDADRPALSGLADLTADVRDNSIRWHVPEGTHRLFVFYRQNTAHNVVGSAYPGALEKSPVIDHLERNGAREYITKLGERWLQGMAPYAPDAFFIDSFEMIGQLPWTHDFDRRFLQKYGYAIRPYLPLLFREGGEAKYSFRGPSLQSEYRSAGIEERVREDYEQLRGELFVESYVFPLKEWARGKNIHLRVQAHGGYGDYLDVYQAADIPESEGFFANGSYDFLKLASSAGHLAGRPVISSESFISLIMTKDRIDPEEYYLLAGNAYSAGINRTVHHGYAYHYRKKQ